MSILYNYILCINNSTRDMMIRKDAKLSVIVNRYLIFEEEGGKVTGISTAQA